MLIITPRQGESFFTGDDIEVVILQAGSQVRIGINAPREIDVVRTELFPADEDLNLRPIRPEIHRDRPASSRQM